MYKITAWIDGVAIPSPPVSDYKTAVDLVNSTISDGWIATYDDATATARVIPIDRVDEFIIAPVAGKPDGEAVKAAQ